MCRSLVGSVAAFVWRAARSAFDAASPSGAKPFSRFADERAERRQRDAVTFQQDVNDGIGQHLGQRRFRFIDGVLAGAMDGCAIGERAGCVRRRR